MDLSARNWIIRYGFAALVTALMVAATVVLTPAMGGSTLILLIGAVALSAWIVGLGPAMLSAVLSLLAADYFLFQPAFSLSLTPANIVRMAIFGLVAFLIALITESQQRMARETRTQRELFRTTLASIGDAVIATDAQGRVYFMNEVAETLTGWTQQEANSRDIHEVFNIVNAHTRQPVENPVHHVIKEGIIVGLANHTLLIRKDHKEIAIDDSGSPVRDDRGEISGAVLVFRDVTTHRKALEAQRELAAIVASSSDAIIGEDLNGLITSWNKAAEEMYGYTAEEALGKPISILMPADYIDDMVFLLERTKAGERVEHFETLRQHKDGSRRDVSLTLSPIYDGDGHVKGVSKIVRDVTDRKRQESIRHFLSEASAALASSLDYETTLKRVAELAVPEIATWCSVYIVQPDGTPQRVALTHVNPDKVKWAEELGRRYPPDPNAPTGLYQIIRSGQPELFPYIPQQVLTDAAKGDDELLRIIEELQLSASMSYPLIARGRTLGIIQFVAAEAGRHYTEDDFSFGRQLAERAAIAVDNARLYHEAQQARQIAERLADRKTRLQAITASLSNLLQPEQVAQAVVTQVIAAFDSARGALVALVEGNGEWVKVVHYDGYQGQSIDQWLRMPLAADLPITVAIRRGEPVLLESREAWLTLFPGAVDLMTSQSLALLPLIVQGQTIGALTISFGTMQSFDEEDRTFMMSVAYQCAQAMERAQLYDAERRARARAELNQQQITFLAEASAILASSLDYQTTLASVVQLAVPKMADWATLHMLQKDGSVAQVATVHVDPAKVQWADEFRRRYPADPNAPTGAHNVLRTGKSEFNPYIPDELLAKVAKDEEHLQALRQLGFKAGMLVPIVVRGKPQGVIQFVSAESGRHYIPEDLTLAEELARRAAVAIENSLLYSEVREQRERLQVTLSSIGDAVIATDERGRVTFMNPVAEALTRWTQDEAAGHDLHDVFNIVNETTRLTVESPVTKVMREGTIVGLANHTILIGRDGSEVPIDDSGAPIRDEQGNIAGVILVFRDITDRKRAEDRDRFLAAASETFAMSLDYETTLQNIARLAVPTVADWCAIDLKDEEGQIRQVILAHSDPDEEARIKEFREAYLSTDERLNPALTVLNTMQPILIPEVDQDTSAGTREMLSQIKMQSIVYVPLVSRGEALGVLSFTSSDADRRFGRDDLTLAQELARRAAVAIENARLYSNAQRAIQIRDEFLSVAAHELKTPVTSLRGFAQTIIRQLDRDNILDPVRVRRALEAIDQQSLKLAALIGQLLDISRIEAGRLELDRVPTDICELVSGVINRVQGNTSRHEIMLDAPDEISAEVDPLRIEQVITNLVDNAVKYSPDGGPIRVQLSSSADQVKIAVSDHGLGIPSAHRGRIFERFYQVHGGAIQGMGLGLYISRQIVELHGGEIFAEHPDDGGTRFVVTLPKTNPERETSQERTT